MACGRRFCFRNRRDKITREIISLQRLSVALRPNNFVGFKFVACFISLHDQLF